MSQLFLLRQFVQKHHIIASACFQQNHINKFSQCVIRQQKVKRNAGQELELRRGSAGGGDVSMDVKPLGEKIKETTETASYTAIILIGVGATAIMLWAICRELFSSSSANSIYSDALERAIQDPRVQDSLGTPIKGYGEESRRGRRQHIASTCYERDGVPHTRMRFYIEGIRNKATVHLESRKTPSGEMQYRYLFVQLDHYPKTTIILEDNRASDPKTTASRFTESALSFDDKN